MAARFNRIVLLLLSMPAASCAGHTEEADYSVIEMPYVTNRARADDDGDEVKYTTDVAGTSGGVCELRVHEMPDAEVVVEHYRVLAVDDVLARLEQAEDRRVTLYVHGYNIGLGRACRDAAVLARRTGFEGRTLLFSWPASRTVVTYRKDERRLAESMEQIVAVLDELGRRHGRDHVNIVAHSMGSRIVLEAIESLEVQEERFGNLVLIAPDIDRDLFIEVLPDLTPLVRDITVLASDDDRLLLLSQTVNLGSRLGQANGGEIDGVDIIDVTDLDDDGFGGHVYHLTNESVGKVIGAILDGKAGTSLSDVPTP